MTHPNKPNTKPVIHFENTVLILVIYSPRRNQLKGYFFHLMSYPIIVILKKGGYLWLTLETD